MLPVMFESNIPDIPGVISLLGRGKVRDMYDLGSWLLIITTDRISTNDVRHPTPIPGKGEILNEISAFWFNLTKGIVPNHLITTDFGELIALVPGLEPFESQIKGRSMLVKKAERIDVECVVRGYLDGSGWKEYQKEGTVCGIQLPEGLIRCQRLPENIFTPTTKAESGHDMPLTMDELRKKIGKKLAEEIRDLSLAVYEEARAYAEMRGIIIADTKFEFGRVNGETILIDEILSPDSSRFWPRASYQPGGPQPSFDKQFVRDYVDTLDWNKKPPAPALPPEIVAKTTEKYQQARDILLAA